jgi:hypothetical protein
MLILREELTIFINVYNAYLIKPQRNRLNYVAGVLNELYRLKEQQRFEPNYEVLTALKSAIFIYSTSPSTYKKTVKYN